MIPEASRPEPCDSQALLQEFPVRHVPAWILCAVLDGMREGVAVVDREGRVLLCNREGERLAGIGSTQTRPEEWTNTYGIYYPDGETPVPTEYLPLVRAMRGESVDDFEVFVRNPKIPEGIPLSLTARPLLNSKGELWGGFVIFRDLTSQMKSEEALRSSERRFRALIERSSDGIALLSREGEVLYSGPSTQRILGYGPSEVFGRSMLQFVHPDDHAGLLADLGELLRSPGSMTRTEVRVCRKDGSWVRVESVLSNHLANPDIGAIVANFREVDRHG